MSAPTPWPDPAPSAGPRAGLFAVPAGLLVLALALVATVVALQWDGLAAAGDGETAGPNTPGVQVELVRGVRYDVYVEATDRTSSTGPGGEQICVLSPAGARPATVPLTGGRPGAQVARDGFPYWHVGGFAAPVSGPVAVTCAGGAGALLLRAGDRPYVVLAVAIAAAALLCLLGLTVLVALVLLRRRRRGNQPEPAARG